MAVWKLQLNLKCNCNVRLKPESIVRSNFVSANFQLTIISLWLFGFQRLKVRQRDAGSRGTHKDCRLWHVQGECVWWESCHNFLRNSWLHRSRGVFHSYRCSFVFETFCCATDSLGSVCMQSGVSVCHQTSWITASYFNLDPAGTEVLLLCWLVVLWGVAVWNAGGSVTFPWRWWGWVVWVHPHGYSSLSSLDQQGGQGPAWTGLYYTLDIKRMCQQALYDAPV